MKTLNANGIVLSKIFGQAMPQGATSCSTQDGVISFLVGEAGEFVEVPMTATQKQAVKEAGLLGTFGRELI